MEELTRIYSVAKKLNSVYAMQKYIVKLGDKLMFMDLSLRMI